MAKHSQRPIAVVTGASRKIGIGAAIAHSLAAKGWDIALTYWRPYDASMPWGSDPDETEVVRQNLHAMGARASSVEADLAQTGAAVTIFDRAESELGPVSGLILAHCHGVDSDLITTTPESFDQHYAVNVRGTWQLVREFGLRFKGEFGSGRIVSITSDHYIGNLPYGATKAAMDRVVNAAAFEFKHLGVTANIVNPGGTDTGWMSPEAYAFSKNRNQLGRVGLPQDCANLVAFLCSPEGGWINAQHLFSNGGI